MLFSYINWRLEYLYYWVQTISCSRLFTRAMLRVTFHLLINRFMQSKASRSTIACVLHQNFLVIDWFAPIFAINNEASPAKTFAVLQLSQSHHGSRHVIPTQKHQNRVHRRLVLEDVRICRLSCRPCCRWSNCTGGSRPLPLIACRCSPWWSSDPSLLRTELSHSADSSILAVLRRSFAPPVAFSDNEILGTSGNCQSDSLLSRTSGLASQHRPNGLPILMNIDWLDLWRHGSGSNWSIVSSLIPPLLHKLKFQSNSLLRASVLPESDCRPVRISHVRKPGIYMGGVLAERDCWIFLIRLSGCMRVWELRN